MSTDPGSSSVSWRCCEMTCGQHPCRRGRIRRYEADTFALRPRIVEVSTAMQHESLADLRQLPIYRQRFWQPYAATTRAQLGGLPGFCLISKCINKSILVLLLAVTFIIMNSPAAHDRTQDFLAPARPIARAAREVRELELLGGGTVCGSERETTRLLDLQGPYYYCSAEFVPLLII